MTRHSDRLAKLEATVATRAPAPSTTPHCRTHGSLCPSIDPAWSRFWEGLRQMGTIGDRDRPCDLIQRVVPGLELLDEITLPGETGRTYTGRLVCDGTPGHRRNRDLPDPAGPEHFGWRLRMETPDPGFYHVKFEYGAWVVWDKFGFLPDREAS